MLPYLRNAAARIVARLHPGRSSLSIFDDSYADFHSAAAACIGYDDDVINVKSTRAAMEVIEGRAAFERDGVVFLDPEPRMPILETLKDLQERRRHVRVLDFGGGLGSSYWQNVGHERSTSTDWTIVERPALVSLAQQLPTHPITYTSDLEQALESEFDIVIFSSVLQYLPDPHRVLRQVHASSCRTVLVDRTPQHAGALDIATVQHTPAHIYTASYPAWIFGATSLEDALPDWVISKRFPGIEPPMRTTSGMRFTWEGFVAEKRER